MYGLVFINQLKLLGWTFEPSIIRSVLQRYEVLIQRRCTKHFIAFLFLILRSYVSLSNFLHYKCIGFLAISKDFQI